MASKRDKRSKLPASGLESLITALKRELEGETAPEGWHTTSEIANMLGISFEATRRLAARKKWDAKQFTTKTSDNKKLLVRHYQIK